MSRRHHPLDITIRVLVAILGGYALTILGGRMAAAHLPMEGGEAAIAASLGAWLAFLIVAIWAFAARSPVRAVLPVMAAAGLFYVVA